MPDFGAGLPSGRWDRSLLHHLGSRRFPVRTISLILATVLVLAGCKLIFT